MIKKWLVVMLVRLELIAQLMIGLAVMCLNSSGERVLESLNLLKCS